MDIITFASLQTEEERKELFDRIYDSRFDTPFNAYILTHISEVNYFLDDVKTGKQLVKNFGEEELNRINFPYSTNIVKERRKEIRRFAGQHPELLSNDVDEIIFKFNMFIAGQLHELIQPEIPTVRQLFEYLNNRN